MLSSVDEFKHRMISYLYIMSYTVKICYWVSLGDILMLFQLYYVTSILVKNIIFFCIKFYIQVIVSPTGAQSTEQWNYEGKVADIKPVECWSLPLSCITLAILIFRMRHTYNIIKKYLCTAHNMVVRRYTPLLMNVHTRVLVIQVQMSTIQRNLGSRFETHGTIPVIRMKQKAETSSRSNICIISLIQAILLCSRNLSCVLTMFLEFGAMRIYCVIVYQLTVFITY